jgi:transposase
MNSRRKVVVRKRFSRSQFLRVTANRETCLMGMAAYGGAPFLGPALREQGHGVRLIAAEYV